MPNAFITGTSSGLGHGLAESLIKRGWHVFGCSRRHSDLPGMTHRSIDLTNYATLPDKLQALLGKVAELELVVLNAGILGEIRDLNSVPMEDAKKVMEINVWANKAIMDWLHERGIRVGQIIMMSSGASILGKLRPVQGDTEHDGKTLRSRVSKHAYLRPGPRHHRHQHDGLPLRGSGRRGLPCPESFA